MEINFKNPGLHTYTLLVLSGGFCLAGAVSSCYFVLLYAGPVDSESGFLLAGEFAAVLIGNSHCALRDVEVAHELLVSSREQWKHCSLIETSHKYRKEYIPQ